ncbi:MAG: hypothetical protein HY401_03615 [Elusimicrobia bacterium]|nr:hypothetical protein [Elusimicrobiota bacterium]
MPNNSNQGPTLLLFDAYHYLHRAYHALPPLTTKQGEPVAAVFGCIKTIIKLLKKFSPTHFAVCWDSKPTDRLALDASYKANRTEAPDDLKNQIALARDFIQAWGLPLVKMEGQEADDLMASLAARAASQNIPVVMVSSDKDLMQLVRPGISMYIEHKEEWMDETAIKKKFGVAKEALIDYFALVGDATDNIIGVPGVGPKTAQKLIADYGSVAEIIRQSKDAVSDLPEKLRSGISANEERLKRNLELVRLKEELPLNLQPEDLLVKKSVSPEFEAMLIRLGFVSVIGELRQMGWMAGGASATADVSGAKQDRAASAQGGKVVLLDDDNLDARTAQEFFNDPDRAKVVYDWKENLHQHPDWAGAPQGELLDVKLLAWVADAAQESYQIDWLLGKYRVSSLPELALVLKDKIQSQNAWSLYESVELPLIGVLFDMERAGVAVDAGYFGDLRQKWSEELERLKNEFIELSGAAPGINLNSPKQLSVLLFEKMQLPVIRKTKTGYSTDEEVLKKLEPRHPAIAKLLSHRELAKLQSTYLEGLLTAINPKTGRVHATFHQEGTQTGRLSCSNPNLQNIPIRTEHGLAVRRGFIAGGPDWELLSLDYSQVDLRAFAHLSGDAQLIKFFKEGCDIHQETAKALLAGPDGQVTGQMRRQAKAINFGVLYGMGSWGLSETLGISHEEAQLFIDRYFERFPGVAAWREAVIAQAHERGWVSTMLGRRRSLPFINASRKDLREFSERAAVNTPVQGSSADIIKVAMIKLQEYIKEKKLQSRLLIQVHDEILMEGPADEIISHQEKFREIMERAVELAVPLVAHVKKGKNWADLS